MMRQVVKVGGSVMDWPRLVGALQAWLARQPSSRTLIVVGGGKLADGVRDLDRCLELDQRTSHRMAVRAMTVNGFAVKAMLGLSAWVTDPKTWLANIPPGARGVLDPESFLSRDERDRSRAGLPFGWHVTSDSIAAHVAQVVNADELALLKSALPSLSGQFAIDDAASNGYVDSYFPIAARGIARIRAVNLRDPQFAEVAIRT